MRTPQDDDRPPLLLPSPLAWVLRHPYATVAIALAILIGIGGNAARATRPTEAGIRAASACLAVVEAGREAAAGTRTVASFRDVAERASEQARRAAAEDPRFAPIAQAITTLATSTSSAPIALLIRECG